MTRFKAPVQYARYLEGGLDPTNASRFSGAPMGLELLLDWQVFDPFAVINDDTFPAASEEPGASWSVTVTGSTPVATASDDLVPARIIITNSGSDNNSWEGQYTASTGAGEMFNIISGKKRYFGCQFLLTDTNDDADTVEQVDVFLGLAITDTDVIDGATDFIGFNKADGSGLINFVSGKNAGTSGALIDDIVQSTGVTLTASDAGTSSSNLHSVEFMTVGTDTVLVYADKAHVATVKSTTEIPDDEELAPTICLQNGEGVAKIMHIVRYVVAIEL